MAVFKFTIPGRLISANTFIDESRKHAKAANRIKQDLQHRIFYCACRLPKRTIKKRVNVHVVWYEQDRRRDKDNVRFAVKFILDALVNGQILINDNWKYIGDLSDEFRVDSKNPRVEVILTEVE